MRVFHRAEDLYLHRIDKTYQRLTVNIFAACTVINPKRFVTIPYIDTKTPCNGAATKSPFAGSAANAFSCHLTDPVLEPTEVERCRNEKEWIKCYFRCYC